jgi:hypothetical protein
MYERSNKDSNPDRRRNPMATQLTGSFFTVNLDTCPWEALAALKDMLGTVIRVGKVSKAQAKSDPSQDRRRTKAWVILQSIKNGAGHLTFDFGAGGSEATLTWNGTGSTPYNVALDSGFVTCDCIDAERNERLCKHRMGLIGAVHAAREEVAQLLCDANRKDLEASLEAHRLEVEAEVTNFEKNVAEIAE